MSLGKTRSRHMCTGEFGVDSYAAGEDKSPACTDESDVDFDVTGSRQTVR